jgi:hypothetical protein
LFFEPDLKLNLKGQPGVKLDIRSQVEVKGTLDVVIDGSSTAGIMTLTGRTISTAVLQKGDPPQTLEVNTKWSSRRERSAEQ